MYRCNSCESSFEEPDMECDDCEPSCPDCGSGDFELALEDEE